MVRYLTAAALVALISSTNAADIPKCGPGANCPESAPCCSAYNQCGVGAYCLGGCDIRYSHSLKSCLPAPVCKSADFKLDSLDDVQDISKYLGDNSKVNWVSSGKAIVYNNDAIMLTMGPDTSGTLLYSSNYVWYGKISATLTTSQGAGVVTAFITMSDTKDEIDFEWVGTDVNHAQSNYYAQGITNYGNAENLTASDTASKSHTYTIDWTPDEIKWLIDGKEQRVKKRSDTWNSTSGRWDFPQTPSRVMLSLWPAGLPSNGKGTVDWAGGLIDWNSPYMQNGFYYALFSDVKIECYDPPPGAQVAGQKSYIYTDTAATNASVKLVDDRVVLKSLFASGEDPEINPDKKDDSQDRPQTVPGVSGIGTRGDNPNGGDASGGDSGSGSGGFSQGSGSTGASGAAGVRGGLVGSQGSVFAAMVAFWGVCLWL